MQQGSVLTQVKTSTLSKHGKTTTTGKFEGEPQNAVIAQRHYSVASAVEKLETPADVLFNNQIFETNTYLQYLTKFRDSGKL